LRFVELRATVLARWCGMSPHHHRGTVAMIHRALIAAAALGLAAAPLAQLAAKPSSAAAAVVDPARSEKHRKLDEGRMPAEILAFTALKPGETVIDYISGSGYYAELFARAVGPKGTVYAINPETFHNAKDFEPILARRTNLRVLVAPVAALQLAPRSTDTLFTHLNYHDMYWESEKYKFPRLDVAAVLAGWFQAVRPGGQVVIIDHAGPAGDPREVADRLHRIDPERVKADMAAAGFVLEAESSVLRRSEDTHDKGVFDPALRGKTDRFVLKFRRP
jgi:predicted methyltransferase